MLSERLDTRCKHHCWNTAPSANTPCSTSFGATPVALSEEAPGRQRGWGQGSLYASMMTCDRAQQHHKVQMQCTLVHKCRSLMDARPAWHNDWTVQKKKYFKNFKKNFIAKRWKKKNFLKVLPFRQKLYAFHDVLTKFTKIAFFAFFGNLSEIVGFQLVVPPPCQGGPTNLQEDTCPGVMPYPLCGAPLRSRGGWGWAYLNPGHSLCLTF